LSSRINRYANQRCVEDKGNHWTRDKSRQTVKYGHESRGARNQGNSFLGRTSGNLAVSQKIDQRRRASQVASPGRNYVRVTVVIGIVIVKELSNKTALSKAATQFVTEPRQRDSIMKYRIISKQRLAKHLTAETDSWQATSCWVMFTTIRDNSRRPLPSNELRPEAI
jgi:hypothetical protein